MNELEILIHKLKIKMKEQRITQKGMAKDLDMSVTTINNVLNYKDATLKSLRAIMEYLDNK